MIKIFQIIIITCLSCLIATPVLNAQSQSQSKGRSKGENLDLTGYRNIKRIRIQLNEGKNEDVARQSERFLRKLKSGRNTGNTANLDTTIAKEYQNMLCVSLTNLGNVTKATEECEKSIKTSPEHWESLKSRAHLNYMKSDFQSALNDFEMSLQFAPDNDELQNVLNQNIETVKKKIATTSK